MEETIEFFTAIASSTGVLVDGAWPLWAIVVGATLAFAAFFGIVWAFRKLRWM